MSVNTDRLGQLTSCRKMSEADFAELAELLAARKSRMLFEDDLLGLYAESLDDSLFINEQATTPDCLTCGACCAYFHQILISIEDATPRSLAWEVVDADGQTLHWLRREPGEARCVALEGEIGGRVSCALYEIRPTACRAFEAGSDRCHALRRMYGLEPPLSADGRNRHLQALKETQREEAINIELLGTLDDERARINFLRELIAYNLDKLEAILTEVMRLSELFNTRGARPAEAHCRQAFETIYDERQLLRAEISPLDFTEAFEKLSEAERNESIDRLLVIGSTAQVRLESAASQLAEIGELAFEVLRRKRQEDEGVKG